MIIQKGVQQSACDYRKLQSLAERRVLRGYKVDRSAWLERERKRGPLFRALLGSRLERGPAEGTLGKQRKGTRCVCVGGVRARVCRHVCSMGIHCGEKGNREAKLRKGGGH